MLVASLSVRRTVRQSLALDIDFLLASPSRDCWHLKLAVRRPSVCQVMRRFLHFFSRPLCYVLYTWVVEDWEWGKRVF